MKKNKIFSILIILTAFFLSANVFAARTPIIEYNGKIIETDVKPFIENDRTLVPIRFISETLGYSVKWNNDTREVTIEDNNTNIKLTIGAKNALVNSKNVELDVAPVIKQDRTFVPLRFVAENLNADVDWDAKNFKVIITKNKSLGINLTEAESSYVDGFTNLFKDLDRDYTELKTNFFEKESKLTKDEIIANTNKLFSQIENTVSKIKNLDAPERFKNSHNHAVKTGEKIVDIIPKLKESMISRDTTLMTGLTAELMDYGFQIAESKNAFEAALKGEEYKVKDDIKYYNEGKENSNLKKSLENIFKNL
ncbi:copper amine oxidase N-terminal domain-containing protein [Peptoniphilus sp. MSJ-1]|uniref:Copper amine oxidase N-terminal domain-containing protein n=1 Tax=Peptoniphilus ovalis TaxID=2841503 RepID=A0ABS6FHI8_9FIRM|nr:copper amine oxidase N-terminal domain-containing protein [Peptoniphilus ovalis]MBU5669431.1 copper amine oxidase N-terminal domain-containing protein [Peptoniphilus ovalis]